MCHFLYYLGGSGIPGPDPEGNFPPGHGRVHVQEAPEELISIRILENVGRTRTFERCRVVPIDTTGNKYQHFARIINTENQMEIAKIRHWYYYLSGINQPLERIYIQFDFIEDNQRIEINAIKRNE
ncbi:hypothetical protein [Telluribacter sp. SYSU D00476]|uniref:hypothetical protein n=1 Tax=Telluribacter sp. SYSU D00476 TaxID=2811430 RepID=UPI001FF13043|nr:hypothetical protein [Telluribacter sp. SYSU D00476]